MRSRWVVAGLPAISTRRSFAAGCLRAMMPPASASMERSSSLIAASWRSTWSISVREPEARQATASSSWRSTRAAISARRSRTPSSTASKSREVCGPNAGGMRESLAAQRDRQISELACFHVGCHELVTRRTYRAGPMYKKLLTSAAAALAFAGPALALDITGAGATFPYPIYPKWADAYRKETGIGMNYQSIGSGAGIKQIAPQTAHLGASDMPLKPEELEKTRLIQVPTVIGRARPVHN